MSWCNHPLFYCSLSAALVFFHPSAAEFITPGPDPVEPPNDFNQDFLLRQNKLRDLHSAPPLTFSDKLAQDATACSEEYAVNSGDLSKISEGCKGPGFLFLKFENNLPPEEDRAQEVALLWYGENRAYDFANPKYDQYSPRFRQLVWVSTKQFGCGTSSQQTGPPVFNYIVCKYDPPGNWEILEGAETFPTTFPTKNLQANVRPFTGRDLI